MAKSNDSSVLFSLRELMSLEEDRVRSEELARQRAEDEVLRARAREEAERAAAERARLERAEEERKRSERAAREEAARLDAMRQAAIERARLDAENAARLAAMRAQHDHEASLASLREKTGKKKLTWVLGIASVALVAGLTITGAMVVRTRDAAQAARAEAASLRNQIDRLDEQTRAARAAGEGKTAEEKRVLEERVLALEAQRKKLERQAERLTPPREPPRAPAAVTPKAKGPPGCSATCRTGDPICVECR